MALSLKLSNSLSSIVTNRVSGLVDSYSLRFDGVDSYIDLDSAVGIVEETEGTFAVWLKINTTTSTRTIMRATTDSNNFLTLFYHAGSNELRFTYRAGGTTKSAAYATTIENDGNFHHVACTWSVSGDIIKLYLDGDDVAENASLGTWSGAVANFDIAQDTLGAKYYSGIINQAALFNTVKSISSIYSDDAAPYNLVGMSNLVGYWGMNEGTGSKIEDSSGQNNDGTLTNTSNVSWVTDVPVESGSP